MFTFPCVWLPVVLPTQIVCFLFITEFFNVHYCFVKDETLHQSIGQIRDVGLDNFHCTRVTSLEIDRKDNVKVCVMKPTFCDNYY